MSINFSVSSTKSVKSGVIQGSVIDPFLFSLCVDTLTNVLCYCKFLLFADDSKLIDYLVNYGYQRFTEDLCQVVLWSEQNRLPLNIAKCQVIHYNGRITQNPCHNYYIKGTKLNSVTECIDLGIARTTDCRFVSTTLIFVQRLIAGLGHLSYTDRLPRLSLPSLKSRRTFLIACFVYKLAHNLIDIPLHEFDLCMSNTNTRTSG